MTYTLALSFRIHIRPADDDVTEAYEARHADGVERVRRQKALFDELTTIPSVARALAAHIILDQAHNEIGDHLTTILGVADDDLYHILRPAIARLPIDDQEVYVNAEVDGSLYDQTGLLVDGCEVLLVDAALAEAS